MKASRLCMSHSSYWMAGVKVALVTDNLPVSLFGPFGNLSPASR
jgi:hypothetical protein